MDDDATLPLSALQHMTYCRRRAALVTIERAWEENRWTAEGRIFHETVHSGGDENRPGVHIARGLPLRSVSMGLYGVADVVEFIPDAEHGASVPGMTGQWRVMPVEYKHGCVREEEAYRVQLCAQALCLEEMLGLDVPQGAIYFGKSHQRRAVAFDPQLRQAVVDTARDLAKLVASGTTPAPLRGSWCRQCSMRDICLPQTQKISVADYMRRMTDDLIKG